MSTEPAIAPSSITSGHRGVSTPEVRVHPVVRLPRERAAVASTAEIGTATDLALPIRCFGPDRQLPAWLIRPWQLLQRAAQRQRPLAARLEDLSKVAQALDELFARHLPVQAHWFESPEATGLSISGTIPRWVDGVISEATTLFLRQLRPELLAKGIGIKPVVQLDEWQRDWLHQHFMQRVYPLLTPLAVDPGRPFPYISSDSLNLLVELRRPETGYSSNMVDRSSLFARVKIPRATPRLIAVPTQAPVHLGKPPSPVAPTAYVCSADLVRFFVHHLFTGMPVRHVYLFRVVRGEQPLPGVTRSASTRVRRQEDQPVVRLDVEHGMAQPVLNWLVDHLNVPCYAVAQHDRLLDWSCLPYLAASLE